MNVIRAQLKGQSCSMKCHWTQRGSNVPFRERLTDVSSPLLAHQRSQQVCTILCCPVTVQIEENTLWFENIDVKMSKWTSIPRSIATLLSGWKQSSCSFPAGISSGLLRSCLGWTFRAFSGCSARSSYSFTAEVTLAVPVEMISPVFGGEDCCVCRMSHTAFSLSATIWILQFRAWPP